MGDEESCYAERSTNLIAAVIIPLHGRPIIFLKADSVNSIAANRLRVVEFQ